MTHCVHRSVNTGQRSMTPYFRLASSTSASPGEGGDAVHHGLDVGGLSVEVGR